MFLLIGADSEIGAATFRHLKSLGEAVAGTTRHADRLGPDRHFLDLAKPLGDWQPPAGTRAACIFVAIARLAACADDPAGSALVNVERTLALVDRLVARDIHVLFLSSNQVFDGSRPDMPADAPFSPVSEYGRQKARTETALRERLDNGGQIATLRLAKVVSPDMALIRGWATALAAGKPIRAFRDMTMAPTPATAVAAAITALLKDAAPGIFQLTGPRDVSYFEIGRYIADRIGADQNLVEGVPAASVGVAEGATPCHTTLDSGYVREHYGIAVPDPWTVIEPIAALGTTRL